MSARPTVQPAPDPLARKTTPEEIAEFTGWDVNAVYAAIQAEQLPGCRFILSQANPKTGRYLCSWAAFYRWFVLGVEPGEAPKDQTNQFIHRIQTLETVRELIASDGMVS